MIVTERDLALLGHTTFPSNRKDRDPVTALKDILGVLLLVLLLPLWMAVGLGVVGFVVARHLYWWARGNTTAVSRASEASTLSPH